MKTFTRGLFETLWMAQVMTLAPGPAERLRIAAVWLLLALKAAFGVRREVSFVVRWTGPAGPISARVWDITELRVIREVFAGGEYKVEMDDVAVVVDLGSNVGISVLYFAARFPAARIIAVEADPRTFARLQSNVAHLPQVTAICAAVAEHDGELTFYSGERSWASSTVPDPDRPNALTVPAMTFETLLKRCRASEGVDLLKMDIEGAERDVLRSPAMAVVWTVVAEFHPELMGESLWSAMDVLLPQFTVERIRGDTDKQPLLTLRRALLA